MRMHSLWLPGTLGLLVGCGGGGGGGLYCEPGTNTCPCLNGLCEVGLLCTENFCGDGGSGTSGDGDPGDSETGDGDPGDGDGDGDAGIPDMTGTFLFALETSLGPDLPLQFATEISNMVIADDGTGATADFTFIPLSLAQGETLIPRACLDETLTYEGVVFDADGNFQIDMGYVMVSGEANPISGFDIEALLNVIGHIEHPDAMCGELEGMVVNPLVFDLAGSTFGAIRLDNDGCAAGTLPTSFPYRCNMVPPPD
jgi:hypothetical protein